MPEEGASASGVSDTACDHLQGKLGWRPGPLGDLHLKSIERPARAYRAEIGADVAPDLEPMVSSVANCSQAPKLEAPMIA